MCVCVCLCGGGLLRAKRVLFASPERQDLIWRVPQPLFPTLCMLHCQEGGERGDARLSFLFLSSF